MESLSLCVKSTVEREFVSFVKTAADDRVFPVRVTLPSDASNVLESQFEDLFNPDEILITFITVVPMVSNLFDATYPYRTLCQEQVFRCDFF